MEVHLKQIQIIKHLDSAQSIIVTARLDAVTSMEEANCSLKLLFKWAS
ncbi:hypothetical protein L798_03829 [Zootermopsis nevadensis]|uniref:Uncharacterized protein n=1 Tax=Zootermopsis nevadensis TaxID=136037 RepID=A0A067QG31_ZOONE|nr:hypothetical protein L798_03829 [Zootermopsis nevadensis]